MSDEENKTRATTGVKFSAFKQVGPQEGNPVEVVGLRDGENVRATLTTDLVETNPEITFRNAKGQFAAVDPGVTELTNQLKVNRYLYDRMLERGVTIDVLPPDVYADGTFWFCNSEGSMQLFVFHEDSDAWIPVAPPATIADRVAAGEEAQGALIEAVGDLEVKVTALEGAVGEHSLIFSISNQNPRDGEFLLKNSENQIVSNLTGARFIFISETDRNGGVIAVDRITEGDVMRLSDNDGVTAELKIVGVIGGGAFEIEKLFGELDRLFESPYDFNLFSSFDPAGLATIDYVDVQDKAIKDYVESVIHVPPSTGDVPTTTKLWKYAEGKDKYSLSGSEFTIVFKDNSNIDVILNPYINGHWWAPATSTNYSHTIGEQYATISDHLGACALGFKARKWWFLQKGTNTAGGTSYHNALQGDYLKLGYPERYRLKDGHWYNLNFPSPFPLVKFPEDAHSAGQSSFDVDDELAPVPDDAIDMGEVLK